MTVKEGFAAGSSVQDWAKRIIPDTCKTVGKVCGKKGDTKVRPQSGVMFVGDRGSESGCRAEAEKKEKKGVVRIVTFNKPMSVGEDDVPLAVAIATLPTTSLSEPSYRDASHAMHARSQPGIL